MVIPRGLERVGKILPRVMQRLSRPSALDRADEKMLDHAIGALGAGSAPGCDHQGVMVLHQGFRARASRDIAPADTWSSAGGWDRRAAASLSSRAASGTSALHGRRAEPGRRDLHHGVLFLSARNYARSTMAEGWTRRLFPPGIRVWSARANVGGAVHLLAVRGDGRGRHHVSGQLPKRISGVPLGDVDTIVTLCAEDLGIALPPELSHESWLLADPAPVRER
ncbi:MAG: hypothetical protein HYV63_06645 [Candidatus Schekmanbacteria bacterium]|nr:hypothetical protein [Candidatus Schekmanbacteria bacterium]